jgi:hypothetical protein
MLSSDHGSHVLERISINLSYIFIAGFTTHSPMQPALNDSNSDVRCLVAHTLGNIGDSEAVDSQIYLA